MLVEELREPAVVVAVPRKVRGDEFRLRVLLEQPVAFREELLHLRVLLGHPAAIGEQRELQPPLVVEVERTEELRRIRGVDEDGNIQASGGSPHGSRSESSSFRRVPSAFLVLRPRPLPISPTPTAPALISASSCATAFSAHPGPTP